jgi:hypothetical protein
MNGGTVAPESIGGLSATGGIEKNLPATKAVLIAVGLIVPGLLLRFLSHRLSAILVALTVIVTSAWVARDSARIGVRNYKCQVAAHPFVLFTACVGFWIVVFPVYLVARNRILAETMPITTIAPKTRLLYFCIAMWLLVPLAVVTLNTMVRTALTTLR